MQDNWIVGKFSDRTAPRTCEGLQALTRGQLAARLLFSPGRAGAAGGSKRQGCSQEDAAAAPGGRDLASGGAAPVLVRGEVGLFVGNCSEKEELYQLAQHQASIVPA
jgi:hypothetical protein